MNYYTFYKAAVPRNRLLRKTLLVMKITTLILLIALMQVSAASVAQRITFVKKNASLEQIFQEITRQTGYEVFYGDKKFDDSRKINVAFKDATLDEVLKTCLQHQRASYVIEEKSIIIKPAAEPTFLERLADRWASIDVHGRVVDQEGKPLPGATVKVKGTGKSVSTNGKGEFFLERVEEEAVLVVSFIGYVSKEMIASKYIDDVVLELSDSKLDEVQVMAYGETTRRLSTGNISTVKAEDIAKQPVNNPLLALIGRVPGLMIEQTSGIAGAPLKLRVQGQNSMGNGNEAFYVIDGVPYNPIDISSNTNRINPSENSAFNFINPADIESIEILKDADATAIYGSRAANGAVLITTKKGKAGKTNLDLNIQSGVGEVGRKVKMMNTEQYLNWQKEAYLNDGKDVPVVYDGYANADLVLWDQNRYTDWQKELIGGIAQYNNIQTSLSGGNESTRFLLGTGFLKETTVFPGNFSDSKVNAKLNVNHSSNESRFKMNVSVNYLVDLNRLPTTDLTTSALILAPNAPSLYNLDGTLNWEPLINNPSITTFDNPLRNIINKYEGKFNNLMSNADASYEIIPGLWLKASGGYNRLSANELTLNPQASSPPTITLNARAAHYANKYNSSWILEPQLNYLHQFDWGDLDVLIGSSFQANNQYMLRVSAVQHPNDAQLENINAAASIFGAGMLQTEYRYNALFGRLGFRHKDRYILNLTARRDGSSRFGAENLFNNFYSIGSAWLFSQEPIFKNNLPFISFGKLKLSYGTTGNDQVPDYNYLSLYNNVHYGRLYQGVQGLTPSGHANPYLQWESTNKLNFGFDLGFLNDRILIQGNAYRNRSSNQLLNYPLPLFTGFDAVPRNLSEARVQNSGIEMLLDLQPIRSTSFRWNMSFNFTKQKNKILSFDNLESSTLAYKYIIGEPANIIRAYKFAGVNTQTGYWQYKDKTGNIVSAPSETDDKIHLIDINPKYFGGFSNTFVYKDFSLDFLFSYVKQIGINNKFGYGIGSLSNYTNQPETYLKRWQLPNDEAIIQKASKDFNPTFFQYLFYINSSDAVYSDASFIRMKNASFSYNFDETLLRKVKLRHARIYIQGQNLFTITSFKGLDPESSRGGAATSLPPLRMISIGLQVTL